MTSLVDKIVAIHTSLRAADLPYGFGGALALAWCTQRARGTIDIDVNVFLAPPDAGRALDALPREITTTPAVCRLLERDGQARLFWDETPIDLFLNTTEYHDQVARRCRREWFSGEQMPFLACSDLAVFKAFFNRNKDWVDLEEMHEAGTLDVDRVAGILADHLGSDDDRISRLLALGGA
jgi:hypothetical protein